jgi:formate dehydrogenase subunit gamma
MQNGRIRSLVQGWMLGVVLGVSTAAWAQAPTGAPPASAPTSAAAAALLEPKPDDTNAVRARSQPGNNAPFWRAVRESGAQQGITNLPGAENGVLVQQFVQYPGSRFTTPAKPGARCATSGSFPTAARCC